MTNSTRRGWGVSITPWLLFTPRERPGTHCTEGWVGPRAGLDRCGKSRPPPGFDPQTVQPIASCYTDWATRPIQFVIIIIIIEAEVNTKVNCVPVRALRQSGGIEVWLHSFLTSAVDAGEWLTSLPGHFIPSKESQYPLNRGLSGSRR